MRKNSADYLEMLFENRNKAYGAYDLRVNYETRLMKSFGMALLIAGFFFLIPFVLTKVFTKIHVEDKVIRTVVYDLSQKFIIEKNQASVQATATASKAVSTDSYKIVKKEEIRKDEKLEDPLVPVAPVPGTGVGISPDSTSTAGPSTGITDSIFIETYSAASVDVIPAFPGGENAMLKYLSKFIRYPDTARENNVAGRVYVSFVIDENGKVTDIKIIRGLGYGTEEEVTRVVGRMPDWSPGKYKGKNVKTAFVMPVLFSLK